MSKILDLNSLSISHIKLLNEISEEIKKDFHLLLDKIYNDTNKTIDWKLNNIFSRNNYYSTTFINLCYLELVKKIISNEKIYSVKCINKSQESILNNYFERENRNIVIANNFYKSNKNSIKPFFTNIKISIKQIIARKRSRKKLITKNKKIILIEMYFIESMFKNKTLKDRYYPGLLKFVNKKQSENLFFLPTFLLRNNYKEKIAIANDSKRNFIYKFDYLKINDYLFALSYPIRIKRINFKNYTFRNFNIGPLLIEDFKSQLCNSSTFEGLLNYRFFRRLKKCNVKLELVINWFENQLLDRGFNLGKNNYYPNVPSIGNLGYVPLYSYKDFQLQPTQLESDMKILPDKISVIGDAIKPDIKKFNKKINVITSPAFRFAEQYRKISNKKKINKQIKIMVALPISITESIDIMNIIIKSFKELSDYSIEWQIRPHPSLKIDIVKKKTEEWPKNYIKSKGTFFENINQVDLLIGNASSTSLESLAFGVPVIIIGSLNSITQNPISKNIPSFMWDICYQPYELTSAIKRLAINIDLETKQKIIHEAEKIKYQYFEPVNKKSVQRYLFNQK